MDAGRCCGGRSREEKALGRQRGSMNSTPDRITPRGSVPDPAQNHGDHEIQVGAESALLAAAQWNVEIFHQKRGQRDVPAFPEFSERCSDVWKIEVADQVVAE